MTLVRTVIGALIELFLANGVTMLGMCGQKLSVMQYNAGDHSFGVKFRWGASFGLLTLGQAFEALALSFATQSVVAALSTLSIVWNVMLAVAVFGEHYRLSPFAEESTREASIQFNANGDGYSTIQEDGSTQYNTIESSTRLYKKGERRLDLKHWDLGASIVLIIGAFVTVVFAPEPPSDPFLSPEDLALGWLKFPFCIWALGILLCCVALCFELFRNWKSPNTGIYIALLVSFLAGFTLTMTKGISTLISEAVSGNSTIDWLSAGIFFVWIICLLAVVVLLNIALGSFEASLIVPIYEICGTTCGIISGILFYQTYLDFGVMDCTFFIIGIFIMIFGIWLTCQRETKNINAIEDGNDELTTTLVGDAVAVVQG